MKVMQPSREEYEQRKEWEHQEKLDHFRVASKMMEFVGVVLGVIAIFVLLALLFSLITWLRQDIASTFSILRARFQ